ncbi:hypothetical protein MTR67_026767 [Solanum verrucosum]|uniref:Uncharacterized protein n=1 Tax=Solanum verrucosum TaxID=315347 RepID=A0AAF0TUA1_SOLVR|nr:hypothetical protein MTR67_026767 [Solanum verrucosum]
MIKGGKTSVLTYAEKCKNILASNWQGYLNTVKADANGSKGEIYTSKVRYFVRRGKPYIWVPENDMHNVGATLVFKAPLIPFHPDSPLNAQAGTIFHLSLCPHYYLYSTMSKQIALTCVQAFAML